MNISAWSIRNPVASIVLFILLSFAGIFSFRAMKVQMFPDMDFPMISVIASLQGASPEQLQSQVARILENAVATQNGVKHIYTTIETGVVGISVEFYLDKDPDKALDEVRSAVAQIQGLLPAAMLPPQVQKIDISGQSLVKYFISSNSMDPQDLSWFIDNTVAKKLLSVSGVGGVNRIGGVDRQIQINLDPIKMSALGLSAASVAQQLGVTSLDASAGQINLPESIESIRMIAAARRSAELAKIHITLPNGQMVALTSFASIVDTNAIPNGSAFEDGKPVVGFRVMRSKGASEIDVGDGVMKKLSELHQQYPTVQFKQVVNNIKPVADDYHSSMELLLEGAILAVIIVWLFLREWRATIISAVALPLSVLPAFVGMHYFGFSINTITLLALSLVVGILVDDAIVEVENIVRHLRMGKTPYQAAMDAADEIGMAVVATTTTLVAVFLPTAFMGGIPGRFFKQFGWTAALAVAASLLVARALTPMMAAYLLKPLTRGEEDPRWLSWYMKKATWCTNHRLTTTIFAGIFFIGSLLLIPLLPSGFMPANNISSTSVTLTLPPGSTIGQTEKMAEAARMRIKSNPYIKQIFITVGSGSSSDGGFSRPGGSAVTTAGMDITLVDRSKRPSKQVIEDNFRQALVSLPGVQISVGTGNSPGEEYQLILSGDNSTTLTETAVALQNAIRTIPGIGNVSSDAMMVAPELIIRPRFSEMADLGVSPADIATTMRISTSGDYNFQLPKLNLPDRQVPIVVQIDPKYHMNLDSIRQLRIAGKKGPVLLGQVADVNFSDGSTVISRYDREQNVSLTVELNGQPLSTVTQAIHALPVMQHLPEGVHLGTSGDAENMQNLFTSFGLAILTGIFCIYLVLVLLFKNMLHPISILAALPLSLGGAFVGLLMTHKSFSMPSLIGLVMLMGIATKNSILLVEYAVTARRNGMPRFEALMDACHKRARPIIMTTIAMAAGMLPAALSLGEGDTTFRAPMAIAVLGGLITSTLLSLLVIPPIFTYIDDFCLWLLKKFKYF
jgi:multidrug efflux pump subunit AcrB